MGGTLFMDRLRRPIMAAALMIAVVEIAPSARSQSTQAGEQPVLIEGLTPEDWIAALEDPDPARRKWALLLIGRATPDRAGNAFSRLLAAVDRLKVRERDPDVRVAADKSLWRLTRALEAWRRAVAERDHAIVRSPLRLVDVRGQPVAGATVSTYFQKDGDRSASFEPYGPIESKTSDSNGEASLGLEVLRHLDATGVYAIRLEDDRPLVGLSKITRDQLGKPITIVMHPACRVRLRVECPGFRQLEEKYHFELDDACWWRAAYVRLGDGDRAPRPLFTSSTTGQLEFLLPPGRFHLIAYGNGSNFAFPTVEVGPGHRVRSLDVVKVAPDGTSMEGVFRGYHHLVRNDPRGRLEAGGTGKTIVLRSVKWGPLLNGDWNRVSEVTFSPDGRRLATAHGNNTDSAEVRLWDPRTGRLVATWPSPDEADGVYGLAFAPDGRTLAGSVGSTAGNPPSWMIVLWDVDGRRAPRTLRGHVSRIESLAFAPDGQTLAGGADKAVIFWDVPTGRQSGRLEGSNRPIVSLAFSPDGRTLAAAAGTTIDLWEWPARRHRARIETRADAIRSIAYAPDGRSLAAAGRDRDLHGRVWLYDLAKQPPSCDAELSFDREGMLRRNLQPNEDDLADVAYTPDGRRVIAVERSSVVIWDAATGVQQDFIDRDFDLHYDRLDISPDGRGLVVTASRNVYHIDISPVGP